MSQAFLGPGNRKRIVFESIVVQPGLSRAQLGDRVGPLLAAADGFVYEWGRFTLPLNYYLRFAYAVGQKEF